MNTHADKSQENKSQSVANAVSQKSSSGESTFQFLDNRPEAVAQRKLQEMANNSIQAMQLKAFQEMVNNSSRAVQFHGNESTRLNLHPKTIETSSEVSQLFGINGLENDAPPEAKSMTPEELEAALVKRFEAKVEKIKASAAADTRTQQEGR